MSKTNGLQKMYDRLDPAERFALDVRAMARGDNEESRRLVHSCPRRPYTMTDVGFSGRWSALLSLVPRAYLPLAEMLGKLEMLAVIREAATWDGAALLDEAERRIARGAFGHWAAFAGFCAEVVGIEAEDALGVVLGEAAVEGARAIRDLAERLELEPDAAVVARSREDFEGGWRLIEERGL